VSEGREERAAVPLAMTQSMQGCRPLPFLLCVGSEEDEGVGDGAVATAAIVDAEKRLKNDRRPMCDGGDEDPARL
jgi:hypothetical protein